MKTNNVKVFSWAILAIFAAACIYFITGVIALIHQGPTEAHNKFDMLVSTIENLDTYNEFMDVDYINAVQSKVTESEYVAAILIAKDEKIRMAYPLSSKLIHVDNVGTPSLFTPSQMIKTFTAVIRTMRGEAIVITAAMYIMKPSDIYKLARTAFLIILAGTLITLLFLLYLFNFKQNDEPKSEEEIEDFPVAYVNKPTKEEEEKQTETLEPIEENVEEEALEPIEESTEEENEIESIADPMGIFSETTGLCKEEQLEPRLDSELSRAASGEHELSLLFLKIDGLEHNNTVSRKIAETLINMFTIRDLIFEYKKDIYALIFQNKDLDETMEFAEKLHTTVSTLIKNEELEGTIGIGLSTRSLRLIPGNRLIVEAQQAVEKSLEEKSQPIVAFRVDPEQYRDYLSNTL